MLDADKSIVHVRRLMTEVERIQRRYLDSQVLVSSLVTPELSVPSNDRLDWTPTGGSSRCTDLVDRLLQSGALSEPKSTWAAISLSSSTSIGTQTKHGCCMAHFAGGSRWQASVVGRLPISGRMVGLPRCKNG